MLNAEACLMVSRPTITPEGTALLDLWLYSSPKEAPAALQWTFQYPPSSITSLTVDDGPSLTSAGKTTICAGSAAAYNCLVMGANANTIANGVIAKLTAILPPGASGPTVQINNLIGVSAEGYFLPIKVSADCGLHPPSRGRSANEVSGSKKEE